MKSMAASKAKVIFADATGLLEDSVNNRRADVLVKFNQPHPRFGTGLAIEVQHEHRLKDIEAERREALRDLNPDAIFIDESMTA